MNDVDKNALRRAALLGTPRERQQLEIGLDLAQLVARDAHVPIGEVVPVLLGIVRDLNAEREQRRREQDRPSPPPRYRPRRWPDNA